MTNKSVSKAKRLTWQEEAAEKERIQAEIQGLADQSLMHSPLRRISHALGAMRVDLDSNSLEVTLHQVDGAGKRVAGLGNVVNVLTMESDNVGYVYRGDGVPPEETLPQLKAKLALVQSLK
ncbi:MAG: hypothetical protein FJY77_02660 [Candidatus Altiarchaeales archaeon]|nr:hypothetical protein [Candidatus Altiarchaeales archaeon]